ncbi:MAG: hypothetical protein AAFR17_12430 [Pseudomonadota bacterium]
MIEALALVTTAAQALTHLKEGVGAAQALNSMIVKRDDLPPDAVAQIQLLNERLAQVQTGYIELQSLLVKYQAEEAARQEWSNIKARYELVKTRQGALIWRFIKAEGDSTPDHFACPVCFEKRVRAFLDEGPELYTCRTCKKAFRHAPADRRQPRFRGL